MTQAREERRKRRHLRVRKKVKRWCKNGGCNHNM